VKENFTFFVIAKCLNCCFTPSTLAKYCNWYARLSNCISVGFLTYLYKMLCRCRGTIWCATDTKYHIWKRLV